MTQLNTPLRLDPTVYRTVTREQWLLRETRLVAALRLDEGLSDGEIVDRAQRDNTFQYPTERMRANIAGVCVARLNVLAGGGDGDGDESARTLVDILAHGTDEQARQANLYLFAASYRLVRECLTQVVVPHLQMGERRLARAELAAFLAELSQQSDVVAGWSALTLDKCRQVLSRCLAEAGLIAPAAGSRGAVFDLRPLFLDPKVAAAIHGAGDKALAQTFDALGA